MVFPNNGHLVRTLNCPPNKTSPIHCCISPVIFCCFFFLLAFSFKLKINKLSFSVLFSSQSTKRKRKKDIFVFRLSSSPSFQSLSSPFIVCLLRHPLSIAMLYIFANIFSFFFSFCNLILSPYFPLLHLSFDFIA